MRQRLVMCVMIKRGSKLGTVAGWWSEFAADSQYSLFDILWDWNSSFLVQQERHAAKRRYSVSWQLCILGQHSKKWHCSNTFE